jgi:FkbM family methyltransferase
MLIPGDTVAKHLTTAGIQIHGVLHIGAHECEERGFYSSVGITPENTVWVEAMHDKVALAKSRGIPNMYQAVISDVDDQTVKFNVSNNGQSSSILEFGTHAVQHPWVHYIKSTQETTVTIDTFCKREGIDPSKYDFWNFDIQGAELQALRGATDAIKHAKAVYLEVNTDTLYKGCALLPEIDDFMTSHGFTRVKSR